MSNVSHCPECGAALAANLPKGLCSRCALTGALGLAPEEATVGEPEIQGVASDIQHPRIRYFGDYELLEEIARGGMGIVYRARQVGLDRIVAVKLLLLGQYASEEFIHRFRIEASAAASLRHPNIVAIHEVGVHQGQHYFAMDFVDGPNLAQLVRDQPLPAKRAAGYVKTIAEAIHFAHTRRILHRDLKPSNVLIDSTDQPRVTDFGLAKNLANDSDLTLTGQVMGSPSFMPPEQALGERGKMGPASDIYSLGAILYHALTGRPPFVGETLHGTLQQVESREPVAPRLLVPSVPMDLETICLKCLEKEPGKRFPSALELAEELARFLRGEPIQSRPVSAPEKLWRWCRRKPALASLGAATILLLLAVAIGSPIAVFRIDRERQRAEANAKRAEHNAEKEAQERQRAQTIVTKLEIQRAQDLFVSEDVSAALAYLARVLRQRPTNQVAAARILSALTQRNFALSLTPALQHEAEVRFAAFSPDGQRVATASNDKTARLWDARSGAALGQPLQHEAEVVWLHFSPDGERLATASSDKTARIWNVRTSGLAIPPLRHTAAVRSAQFSPDGLWVLTASSDKTARIWNAQTGEPPPHVFQHTGAVTYAEFSPDGEWVATASADRTARVWDARTGEPRTPPLQHNSKVGFVRFSPDGELVATAADDSRGRVWDAATGRAVTGPLSHKNWVTRIEFSPDGRRLATSSLDFTAQVWDVRTGQPVGNPLRHDAVVNAAQFSPDGRYLVTASVDRTARLWDIEMSQLLMHPLQHGHRVNGAIFSPDGVQVISASDDKTARIWDIQDGRPPPVRLKHRDKVYSPQFSPDGRLVVTASADHTARVWNAQNGKAVTVPLRHANGLLSVRFSPDGQRVVTASRDSTARVWNAFTGEPLTPALQHRSQVRSAEFSANGQRVVTASSDQTARIWDALTGKLLFELKGHQGGVDQARFSPDGDSVVTVASDHTALIWDARTGKRLGQPLQHEDTMRGAEFSPDGKRIVTASTDTTAVIWDGFTGRQLAGPLKHDGTVWSALFSPDGTKVVTAAFDKTARVWNARTGQPLIEPLKHPDNLRHADFSPDSQRVLTSCEDGAARIWDAQTGQMLGEPFRHEGAVVFAEFSSNGQWIVTASEDKTGRIWEVPQTPLPIPSWLAELAEAIAGGRFDERGNLEAVPLSALLEIETQVQTNLVANVYTRWAQWFFGDRNTRTVSPASSVTMAEWVQQRIEENTVESRQEVESYRPFHSQTNAWRARLILAQEKTAQQTAAADAESRRAVESSPNNPEAWRARAEVLERGSNVVEAVAAWDRAIELQPENPVFWTTKGAMLERNNQLDTAHVAYSKAIEVSAAGPGPAGEARSKALFHRWNFLKRLGRMAEAQTDFLLAWNIPARDAQAPPGLIDLTRHYNAALEQDWHGALVKGNSLAAVPRGRQTFDGVEFDVRGIIQLGSSALDPYAPGYPSAVEGIAVHRPCRRLHFLHALGWGGVVPSGTHVGSYLVRYADGQRVEIPLKNGEDFFEWQGWKAPDQLPNATVAWRGRTPRKSDCQLFQRVWENPHPDIKIESIDFISTKTAAAPFLIAITAE